MTKKKAFVLKNDKIRYFLKYFCYFSYKNVLNISPKLRLDVLINYVLVKKRVCMGIGCSGPYYGVT